MRKKSLMIGSAALLLCITSCRSKYEFSSINRNRILIDNRYDANPDKDAAIFIAPYKAKVDSLMSPIVGEAAEYLFTKRPESNLSNLLSDILIWGGKKFNEEPDFAIYNIGGMRAAIPAGKVTFGDILEVAPFENKICFLTLKGNDVIDLFRQIAYRLGEGVSHGVNLVISKEGKLVSAKVNGKEIDPNANYRIATIDYVLQGNDGMVAFKKSKDVVSPQTEDNNMRYIIADYFKSLAKQGKKVDSKIEGRIIINEEK